VTLRASDVVEPVTGIAQNGINPPLGLRLIIRRGSRKALLSDPQQQIIADRTHHETVRRGDFQSPEQPRDGRSHRLPANRADELLADTRQGAASFRPGQFDGASEIDHNTSAHRSRRLPPRHRNLRAIVVAADRDARRRPTRVRGS
jgi:hypothetical protein